MTPLGPGSLFGTWDIGGSAPVITFKQRGGSSAARKLQLLKASWTPDTTFQRLNDGNGKPSGYNKVRTVVKFSVELVVRYPNGSGALAGSRTEFMPPEEFSVITFANLIAAAHTLMNGDFVYETGATCEVSDEGEASLKFDCFQFFDSGGNAITPANLVAVVS
jgi:hypothetical protein